MISAKDTSVTEEETALTTTTTTTITAITTTVTDLATTTLLAISKTRENQLQATWLIPQSRLDLPVR
jgi:hypothetical protein